MAKRMKPDIGVRLFKDKPLMTRSAYARRLVMLWVLSLVWCGVFVWAVVNYAANPIWLTVLVAAALFLISPEPSLLVRSYDAYRDEWDRDNRVEGATSREAIGS